MRKYSLLLISLFFMQLIIPSPARSGNHVRVGVYQNTPLTFEENGRTKGFFIDLCNNCFEICVSEIVCVGRAMAIWSKELMSIPWTLQEHCL